jgi:hypothetical protein
MTGRCIAAFVLAASTAYADPIAGAAAGTAAPAVTAAATPAHAPTGLAIGAELGDPSAVTAAWFTGKLDIVGALGTATVESTGWAAHADVQAALVELAPGVPLRAGLGLRYYRHSHLASPDEVSSGHLGVRASIAAAIQRGPLEIYAELAPGVDVLRGASCNLADGALSVCPHAQESPLFVQFAIGARWFL